MGVGAGTGAGGAVAAPADGLGRANGLAGVAGVAGTGLLAGGAGVPVPGRGFPAAGRGFAEVVRFAGRLVVAQRFGFGFAVPPRERAGAQRRALRFLDFVLAATAHVSERGDATARRAARGWTIAR